MPISVLLTEFMAITGSVAKVPIVGGLDLSVLIGITSGLVGMGLTDAIFGDDESDEDGDDVEEEDLGDLDEFDDDLEDFDDELDEFDDDLGDLDEDLDDDFGDDFDDGGGSTAQLETRLDDLENEVSQVSSTVGTVRSENEEISESVEQVEENVRQLLDVYEMVTRGVNPFVEEGQDAGGFGGEGFGLFDDDGDDDPAEEVEEEVEDDIANADPESFFDDDFEDEEEDDLLEEEGEENAEKEDGTTFDDLKAEYESDEEDDELADDLDLEPSDEPDDEEDDAEFEFVEDQETTAEPADDDNRTENGSGEAYLTALPDGYRSDLLVMEWLEYLQARSSSAATLTAIQYYEDIDWIGDEVADQLRSTLAGFEADPQRAKADGGRPASLTIDDHLTSLRYIGRLRSEGSVPFAFDVRSAEGGEGHGL